MIIITGGRGFVGNALGLYLREKDVSFRLVDLPEYDITKPANVKFIFNNFKPTRILHLAAISDVPTAIKNPIKTINVNVLGTLNLLEECLKHNIKQFVYMSSASVMSPVNIYASSKLAAELFTLNYQDYGIPISVVRTSNVYGKNDPQKRVVTRFIEKALKKEPMVLEGDGSAIRCFTYIDDLCDGLYKVLTNPKAIGKTINITGEKEYTVKQLAEIILSYVPGQIVYKEGRKNESSQGLLDTKEARNIGYIPQWGLEKGVEEMLKKG